MKIMIVEDDPVIREHLAEALKNGSTKYTLQKTLMISLKNLMITSRI